MNEYLTLGGEASAQFTEKRSRFIGYAKPVSTREQAEAFINEIRRRHWDATHNVYAYVLRDGQQRRYSDDGEPSGTAGVPVLDVLLKSSLTDCCVVATRYFGGVLLGAGGLVRAYSHTSSIAVEAAGIVVMARCALLSVTCEYGFYDRLCLLLKSLSCSASDVTFADRVTVKLSLPLDKEKQFSDALYEASFGKCVPERIGEEYAATERRTV